MAPDGAKADGRGFGIGSKTTREAGMIYMGGVVALVALLGCGLATEVGAAEESAKEPGEDVMFWGHPPRTLKPEKDPATAPGAEATSPKTPQKTGVTIEEESLPAVTSEPGAIEEAPLPVGPPAPQVAEKKPRPAATPEPGKIIEETTLPEAPPKPQIAEKTILPEKSKRASAPPKEARAPATAVPEQAARATEATLATPAKEAREVAERPEATPTKTPPPPAEADASVADEPVTVEAAPESAPEAPPATFPAKMTGTTEAREPTQTTRATKPPEPPPTKIPPSVRPDTPMAQAAEALSEGSSVSLIAGEEEEEDDEPEEPPASVTFLSTPSGATVVVNDETLEGKTPIRNRSVPSGRIAVKFKLEGYGYAEVYRRLAPHQVAEVEVQLEALPARLTLTSKPPRATVWINGRRIIEQTPIHDLPVPPGRGRIELYHSGYEPTVIERTWKPDKPDRVDVKLQEPSARVTFLSTPPGATVTVNGTELPGKTPLRDVLIRPGSATVEFQLEGYAPVKAEREWNSGQTDRMEVRLQPLWARVTFVSKPPGATVKVGGQLLPGKTPIENASFSPGRNLVEFQLDNHGPVAMEREWLPGATDRVEATLLPLAGRARFQTAVPWERIEIDGNPVEFPPHEWREMSPGRHSVQAYRGDQKAHAEFEVQPGRDLTVELKWYRGKPDSDRFVFLPETRAALGQGDYAKENPPRVVEMPAFWISRTEMTVAEYRECVDSGRCVQPGTGENCTWGVEGGDQHPINRVTAKDAEAYAVWLAERDGLPYELPTADQWERAARGAAGHRYPWGDEPPSGQCNSCDKSCPFNHFKERDFDDGWELTAPVGALEKCTGPEGIMDLIGNVAEWCRDEKPDGEYGVRGGSWGQIGAFLDPAFPSTRPASDGDANTGFRLVVPHLPGF